jgi:DNA-binding CsgD family transcriptional regulator
VDLARLALDFLDESVHDATPPRLRARALEHARRFVDYDDAVFASYTDEFFAAPPPYVHRYLSSPAYRAELERAFQVSRRQDGAYVDTEVYSTRERGASAFFSEVIRGAGFTGQIVAVIHFGGVVSGVIHLNRSGSPFSNDDLERLSPFLRVVGAVHAAVEPSVPQMRRAPAPEIPALTPREREVAELISQGKINGDIALILGTSVHTVRRQVESILTKCGVSSRVAVAALVARGLLLERRRPGVAPGLEAGILQSVWGDMQRSIPT